MKLLQFNDADRTRLGVLIGDMIVPLDALYAEYPTMLSIIAGGPAVRPSAGAATKLTSTPLMCAAAPLNRIDPTGGASGAVERSWISRQL